MPSELRLEGPAAPPRVQSPARPAGHAVVCRLASAASERAEHLSIRHRVFVDEQAVFAESDLDSRDVEDSTIAVLGYSDGIAVVEPVEGRWQGDRLAVLSAYRTHGVGAPLVRYAVATAAVRGGRTMAAHIQPANVTFFERLGWARVGETEIYAGLPHQPMSIDLPTRGEGLATVRRLEGGINGEVDHHGPASARPQRQQSRLVDDPHRRRLEPAFLECRQTVLLASGRRAQQECVRRKAGQPLLHRHIGGPGESL